MRESRIPLAPEGYPFIGYAVFLTLLAALLGYTAVSLALAGISTFVLCFFRDPERFPPADEGVFLAPADGKIILAEPVMDARFGPEELLKISIFMNIFNVHVNRIPAGGMVNSLRHVPGTFIAADHDQAHLKNEYCAVAMTTDDGRQFTVVQIAGLIARRIVCRLEPGDTVEAGQRFGLIRFGSRLDLYLPPEAKLTVGVGQKVRAGETVLARIG